MPMNVLSRPSNCLSSRTLYTTRECATDVKILYPMRVDIAGSSIHTSLSASANATAFLTGVVRHAPEVLVHHPGASARSTLLPPVLHISATSLHVKARTRPNSNKVIFKLKGKPLPSSNRHRDAVGLARDDCFAGLLDLLEHCVVGDLVICGHIGGLSVKRNVERFHACEHL